MLAGNIPYTIGALKYLTSLCVRVSCLASHTSVDYTDPLLCVLVLAMLLSHSNLSTNSLTGPFPQTIGLMPELVILKLDTNPLKGTIPVNWMKNLRKLRHLELPQVEGPISESIGDWAATLTNLHITQHQNITGILPAGPLPQSLCNVVCYTMAVDTDASAPIAFSFDQSLFDWNQCDCAPGYYGLPPLNCKASAP